MQNNKCKTIVNKHHFLDNQNPPGVIILAYYSAKYKNDHHHQIMYVQQTIYIYIIHSSSFMMKEGQLY